MNPPASASAASPSRVGNAPFDRDRLPPGVGLPAKGDPDRLGVYRIVGRITRDAAGTVLLGVDGDGAPAVLRLVPAALADAPDVRSRLGAEVGRLVRARALCTAAYRGADVRAAEPWLAAEYVPGRTLTAHVAEHGPLTGGMLTALATGLAESLTAGHAVGATHLALDPTKVVLSPEGPKVVDLGIARATGKPITASRWAAPEQRGATGTDGAATTVTGYADVFAWGALVRFAATGWEPSGNTVDEPELGTVPPHLAPLVRRALVTDPEQRPTALQLLQGLTEGQGEDPAEAVSALLVAEWTGVTVPEPRRVSRVPKPVLVAGTAVVLVAALLGGWAVLRPGTEPGQADTTVAEDAVDEAADEAGETAEEPSGPIVAEAPEAVDAVVAEAVELALGASSFTTYEHQYSTAPGDSTPTHYLQTQDPVPGVSRASYLGPAGSGVMAMGNELEELVHFSESSVPPDWETEREYYRDPGPNAPSPEHPREQWQGLVDEMEEVLGAVELTYGGTGTAPTEYLPPEILGDGELEDRTGHRYTASYVEADFQDHGDVEGTVEFWTDEAGYPLHFDRRTLIEGVITESELPLEYVHLVEFARFEQPVDAQVPEDSEILPERSDPAF